MCVYIVSVYFVYVTFFTLETKEIKSFAEEVHLLQQLEGHK